MQAFLKKGGGITKVAEKSKQKLEETIKTKPWVEK